MKKLLIAIIAIGAFTQAQAYWECGASSVDGFGVGMSDNKFEARDIAMNECRMRTATWNICYVNYCVWK